MSINIIVCNLGPDEPALDQEWLLEYIGFHPDLEGKSVYGLTEYAVLGTDSENYKMRYVRVRDEHLHTDDVILIITNDSPPKPDDHGYWTLEKNSLISEEILPLVFERLEVVQRVSDPRTLSTNYYKGMMVVILPGVAPILEKISATARRNTLISIVNKE